MSSAALTHHFGNSVPVSTRTSPTAITSTPQEAKSNLDPVEQAIQNVEKLEFERNTLLAAADAVHKAAKALLDASDQFQLACGLLMKPADLTANVTSPSMRESVQLAAQTNSLKYTSAMQMFFASDTKGYADYVRMGIEPLLDFVKTLDYDEFNKLAKKTAKKSQRRGAGGVEFVEDVNNAMADRDNKLYKLFANLMLQKGKYASETSKVFEKHRPLVESFSNQLKITRDRNSSAAGDNGKYLRRYPDDEKLPGEGIIVKIENVTNVAGPRSLIGLLVVTHFRLKMVTTEEVDTTTGIVEKESSVVFDIPIASISHMERMDPAKDELVAVYSKDLQEVVLSFRRSSRDAAAFLTNVGTLTQSDSEKSVFAFFSKEKFNFNGWMFTDIEQEYNRLIIPDQYIRLVDMNKDFAFSPTYPKLLAFPNTITDAEIKQSASHRSKSRVISICWREPRSWRLLARCAQPLVGLSNKRNPADEKIIQKIGEWAFESNPQRFTGPDGKRVGRSVCIFDARPRVNALGNMANGGGFEKAEDLDADFVFLNIENIHVVRGGLNALRSLFSKTTELLEEDNSSSTQNTIEMWSERYFQIWNILRRSTKASSWFPMLSSIISGATQVMEAIIDQGQSAVVHCSDGWDRTPQVCATAELLMDGYYRTIEGFGVLIEKEWTSFGHKFAERYGTGKNRTKYQDKQRSPIFLQWLDAIHQIVRQEPEAFQFDSRLLLFLASNLYSCRFGTFLGDNDSERHHAEVSKLTVSIWGYVMDNLQDFQNPFYDPDTESPLRVSSNTKDFYLWLEYYVRWDQVLFQSPSRDAIKVVDHFNNYYARPFNKGRKAAKNTTGIRMTTTSRMTTFEIDAGEVENSKWYDQMSDKILESGEVKDDDDL